VAEGARLESVYTVTPYRGFESLSHRQIEKSPESQTICGSGLFASTATIELLVVSLSLERGAFFVN